MPKTSGNWLLTCCLPYMETTDMNRLFGTLLLSASLMAPVAIKADDEHHKVKEKEKRYYDAEAKDWHEWNEREERAYRRYLEENHRAAHDWAKAKREEQREYWKWRQ